MKWRCYLLGCSPRIAACKCCIRCHYCNAWCGENVKAWDRV